MLTETIVESNRDKLTYVDIPYRTTRIPYEMFFQSYNSSSEFTEGIQNLSPENVPAPMNTFF